MKVVVFGSRTIHDMQLLQNAIHDCDISSLITEIISGGAAGVDTLGELYAKQHGIPCTIFPANWDEYGKRAGILRNIEMAQYADYGIALWDGLSKGTKHMIEQMKGRVHVDIHTNHDRRLRDGSPIVD